MIFITIITIITIMTESPIFSQTSESGLRPPGAPASRPCAGEEIRSKYPNSRVSRPQNHSEYGFWDLKPFCLGTRTLWVRNPLRSTKCTQALRNSATSIGVRRWKEVAKIRNPHIIYYRSLYYTIYYGNFNNKTNLCRPGPRKRTFG